MPYNNAADMRARARDAWHSEWSSKSGLRERLWTDNAIGSFLSKPKKAGKIMAWMEKRREWLDARCRLPDITYATYGLVVIGWDIASPDKPVRFQELVWNEDRQELVDLPHKRADSPYTGAEFDGCSPDEVACAICEWFIRRKPG